MLGLPAGVGRAVRGGGRGRGVAQRVALGLQRRGDGVEHRAAADVDGEQPAVRVAVQYLESQARKNHVALEFDLQEEAPTFDFDDMFVMRIAENLVGNAVKAVVEMIPDDWLAKYGGDIDVTFGSVGIRYRYLEDHHILEVEDEGPGMSVATIRQILTGKARSAWIRNTGSGLGTKAVLELAATHDARVSIDSKLGEGTTFRVDFPQAMSETGAA